MDAIVIVLAALIVPVLWGCGSHWLLERIWPRRNGRGSADKLPAGTPAADYLDFQI
jgi:hypothetical protein